MRLKAPIKQYANAVSFPILSFQENLSQMPRKIVRPAYQLFNFIVECAEFRLSFRRSGFRRM